MTTKVEDNTVVRLRTPEVEGMIALKNRLARMSRQGHGLPIPLQEDLHLVLTDSHGKDHRMVFARGDVLVRRVSENFPHHVCFHLVRHISRERVHLHLQRDRNDDPIITLIT